MLRRAVQCFARQTWGPRELLVLHEDGDHDTRDFLVQLAHPLVRSLVVPAEPHLTLGRKRQISVEAARGDYVATWDDDDWSSPTRLAEQMDAIGRSAQPVCVLEQWIVHDQHLRRSYLSQPRAWEASMIARRDVLPAYGDAERGTDHVSMASLLAARRVIALRRPHLYIHLYHGANVGSRVHFKRNIFAHARLLPESFSRRVEAMLAWPPAQEPISLSELQDAAARA